MPGNPCAFAMTALWPVLFTTPPLWILSVPLPMLPTVSPELVHFEPASVTVAVRSILAAFAYGRRGIAVTAPLVEMVSAPVPLLPTVRLPEFVHGRIGAGHGRAARRPGGIADRARRITDCGAIFDVERAGAGAGDDQRTRIGPFRAGIRHGRGTGRTQGGADSRGGIADRPAGRDGECALAGAAFPIVRELVLVQLDPAPSTVAVPVPLALLPKVPPTLLTAPPF